MWIADFIRELKVWKTVRKVYRKNKEDFLKLGLKMDWVGHIYKVTNRDVNISLGSKEDEELIRTELLEIQQLLIKHALIDILAYEMKPLEEYDKDTYEHAYLIVFTPAYRLDKQLVSLKSVSLLSLLAAGIITALVFLWLWVI